MGLAVLRSRALASLAAPAVTVEVHLATGLPAFTIVGLAEAKVRESKDRVRAALLNGGFDFPAGRVTVNLAPADLLKESGRFDLPIALGILAASGQLQTTELDRYEFAGELSLSGALRPIRASLAMSYAIHQQGDAQCATRIHPTQGQCRRNHPGDRRSHLSCRIVVSGVRTFHQPRPQCPTHQKPSVTHKILWVVPRFFRR